MRTAERLFRIPCLHEARAESGTIQKPQCRSRPASGYKRPSMSGTLDETRIPKTAAARRSVPRTLATGSLLAVPSTEMRFSLRRPASVSGRQSEGPKEQRTPPPLAARVSRAPGLVPCLDVPRLSPPVSARSSHRGGFKATGSTRFLVVSWLACWFVVVPSTETACAVRAQGLFKVSCETRLARSFTEASSAGVRQQQR